MKPRSITWRSCRIAIQDSACIGSTHGRKADACFTTLGHVRIIGGFKEAQLPSSQDHPLGGYVDPAGLDHHPKMEARSMLTLGTLLEFLTKKSASASCWVRNATTRSSV
jgi:hypothetical protein